MRAFLNSIKVFTFWGIVFLLIFLIGFHISMGEITADSKMSESDFSVYCSYFIYSTVLYPILLIITNLRNGLTFRDMIAIGVPSTLWAPYKGLALKGLFKSVKEADDSKWVMKEIGTYIRRLLHTVLWWFIVLGIISSLKMKNDNPISNKISGYDTFHKVKVIVIFILIYCVVLLASIMFRKFVMDEWGNESREFSEKGTLAQKYYDRHPEKIPNGSRECGGPYPECKMSCRLFDD